MQSGHITTPFGRRSVNLALVKDQFAMRDSEIRAPVEKWKVFRDVCEARERFGLQDRAIAVLDALLTFYPEPQLDPERGLVVFPSNAQLSVRAHGITESTLRRQLASLVEAGLIQRRDSPNGKRYAYRDRDGQIEHAYGFDLTPLLARASEIALIAQEIAAERMRFRRAKEALTICRRDVRKLITAAMEEGAPGNWEYIETVYAGIVSRHTRYADRARVEKTLEEMELLREEVLNHLDFNDNGENMHGNAVQNARHIQNSNTDIMIELEPSSGREQGDSLARNRDRGMPGEAGASKNAIKAFPLGMVLRACPQIGDYGPPGGISHWREFMTAAVVVRSMLGVSPSAYEEACDAMGPENAAVAMACILERSNFINSAGGYLRDLTKRAARDEFSLGPMLMALLRANGESGAIAS